MKYQLLNENCEPVRAHKTDAGMDLKSSVKTILGPKQEAKIGLGIKAEIPVGYCALLIPRSGIGGQGLELMNTVGAIDTDYRGEWIAKVRNKSDTNVIRIDYGERIVQCILVPIYLGEWYRGQVNETIRGEGGFGHTGKK